VGLQTIVQLPSKEAKRVSVPRRLKSLALTLSRAAKKVGAVFSDPDVRHYIDQWDDSMGRARALGMPGEIEWGSVPVQLEMEKVFSH